MNQFALEVDTLPNDTAGSRRIKKIIAEITTNRAGEYSVLPIHATYESPGFRSERNEIIIRSSLENLYPVFEALKREACALSIQPAEAISFPAESLGIDSDLKEVAEQSEKRWLELKNILTS